MMLEGRVWLVGDGVGATDLVPARYDKSGMQRNWTECARHLLADTAPGLAEAVRPGDILIAGDDLGAGHAHYYMAAIRGAEAAGIAAMLASSVNTLFFRAAIDAGVPCWSFPGITALATTGDRIRVDLRTGGFANLTTGAVATLAPVSQIVLDILDAGGADRWALRRLGLDDGDAKTPEAGELDSLVGDTTEAQALEVATP